MTGLRLSKVTLTLVLLEFLAHWLTWTGDICPSEYKVKNLSEQTAKQKAQERYMNHNENLKLISEMKQPIYGPSILLNAYKNMCIRIVLDPDYKNTQHYRMLFEMENTDA